MNFLLITSATILISLAQGDLDYPINSALIPEPGLSETFVKQNSNSKRFTHNSEDHNELFTSHSRGSTLYILDNVDNETDGSAEGWESNLWDDWYMPSQDFETNFDDYDTSNVEDFSVSTTVELFAIGTVIKVDLDPLLIDGFNINIHTSEEHAKGSLVGDLISEYVPIDEIYFDQLPNQPGNYRFIVNAYFSPTIAELPTLLPGDYWLSFTPVNNFSINDQTWMRYSNPNLAQSDAFGVSPGNGYGFGEVYSLNGPMPYVLTGDPVAITVPGDFPDIQSAIDAASAGDVIEVSEGNYVGDIFLAGVNDLTIIAPDGPTRTVIQGDGTGPVITVFNSSNIRISGFTIKGGNNNIGGGAAIAFSDIDFDNCIISDNYASMNGGGVAIGAGSESNFDNVVFNSNVAGERGGGIYRYGGSSSLVNCSFTNNLAVTYGGGIYAQGDASTVVTLSIQNTLFEGNTAEISGGAIASSGYYDSGYIPAYAFIRIGDPTNPENTGCVFRNNSAEGIGNSVGQGGAIYFDDLNNSDYTYVFDSLFEDNSAEVGGGAMFFNETPTYIFNSRIIGNAVNSNGGGLELENSSYFLKNCIIDGNAATRGGGIVSNYSANIFVLDCVVASNKASAVGGGISMIEGNVFLYNSILWNNAGSNGTDLGGQVSRYSDAIDNVGRYSCIQGSDGESWSSDGYTWEVLNQDPRFVDLLGPDGIGGTGDEDYRLLATSPCIDAGFNGSYIGTEYDYTYQNQFLDDPYSADTGYANNASDFAINITDIGAYEHIANELGQPGDKIWDEILDISGATFDYTANQHWLPESPVGSDRAVLVGKPEAGGLGYMTLSYLGSNASHKSIIVPSEINNILFGTWESGVATPKDLILDNPDGPELLIGPYIDYDLGYSQFAIADFYGAAGTLVAEDIVIRGEGPGQFALSTSLESDQQPSVPSLLTQNINVMHPGTFFVSGGSNIDRLNPKSPPVMISVQGTLVLTNDWPSAIDGSFSLESIDDSSQGTIQIKPVLPKDSTGWTSFSESLTLSGTLSVNTGDIQSMSAGESMVLFESEGTIDGNFNCVSSTGFSDDRFIYVTIENSASGGQNVVLNVESASNLLGFGDPENTALGGNAADAELGDMDSDGDADLVISLPAVNQVVVLLNGGNDAVTGEWLGFSDGSIAENVDSTPLGLDIGDVEGDDELDIAVACKDSDSVVVLENTGSNFSAVSYSVDDHISGNQYDALPVDVAIGNFEGDNGDNDLAVVNSGDSTFIILSSGTTRALPLNNDGATPLNAPGSTIDPGDVNNDKDLDPIVISSRPSGKVAVAKGQTALMGTTDIEYYDVGSSPEELVVGDLNGDGLGDIATADNGTGTISVLIQDSDGSYLPATSFLVGPLGGQGGLEPLHLPLSISIGDYDVDGDLDLACVVYRTNSNDLVVKTIRNDSSGNVLLLSIDNVFGNGSNPSLVRSADVNNDLTTDIVVINSGSNGLHGGGDDSDASTYVSSITIPTIENDLCVDAIPAFEGVTKFTTLDANTDGPVGDDCQYDMPHNDIWYTYTATCSGTLTISTCGTVDYDSNIALYTGSCERLELVGCNDDADGCPDYSSELIVQVIKGQTYIVEIGGWSAAEAGTGTFTITLDMPESEAFFDQIGNGCDELPSDVSASQYFETDYMVYDIASIESFTLTKPYTITTVETVINGWNGFSDINQIQWYELNIYSSSDASGDSISGDVASQFIPSDKVTIDKSWGGSGTLVSINTTIGLNAGDYFISIVPRNDFADNGQTGIQHGINGDGVSHQANPNEGFENGSVWLNSNDLAYRIFADEGVDCVGDLNSDSIVDVNDLLELIANWGDCSGCSSDLNGDGIVDVNDLLELIANWGPCI